MYLDIYYEKLLYYCLSALLILDSIGSQTAKPELIGSDWEGAFLEQAIPMHGTNKIRSKRITKVFINWAVKATYPRAP